MTLSQMLKALDKDVAVDIGRKLKNLSKKKALQTPLDKNKADQVQRKVAYEEASKEVSKWEPIVDKHRNAKQIKFPLDQQPDVLPSVADTLAELKPINEFEVHIQDAINGSESALRDNKLMSRAEEKYLKAISVDEAQERHLELQRMRVLLSSYAAKMRRQKQIKSKSYRRLLKHERIRRNIKKIESDKDLLMEEIDKLQKLRAQERASLKHKNTGKWAKHAKFRAKYDEEARNAMIEQIGLAEKLLKKPADIDSDSESEEEEEEEDVDDIASSDDGEISEEIDKECTEPIFPTFTVKPIVSTELSNEERLEKRRKQLLGEDDEEDDEVEEDEDDDQRKLMSEAFADDDVVAEFQKAKDAIADEEQPKDKDTYLPGWGDWTGPGIKENKRKRQKYIIKAKKVKRKDDNLGNVIISEQADASIKEKMVKKLPRGVNDDKHFKKMLTRPIAATFVTQAEHRESIKPRISTKMGARIEPMNKRSVLGNKTKWT